MDHSFHLPLGIGRIALLLRRRERKKTYKIKPCQKQNILSFSKFNATRVQSLDDIQNPSKNSRGPPLCT